MSQLSQPTTTRPLARSWPLLGSLALALVVVAALPLLWRSLSQIQTLLSYPYPTDQLEGTLLHEARLWRSGEPLYQPLELYRFVSAPYPPLHPLVLGWVDQLVAGPHVFWSGRLISIGAMLLIGGLITLLARRVGGSWLAGLLGAAVFLSAPPALLWGTRIKPDLFALLWTTLGLTLSAWAIDGADAPTRRSRIRGWATLLLALLAFGLAFLTKQTAVMAPFATGLALLAADLRGYWRRGRSGYLGRLPIRARTLVFGLGYLALTGGLWLLLDLLTDGNFSAHIRGLHRSEWWTMELVRKYIWLLAPYWPLMLLALALWAALLRGAWRDDRALIPACYALVAPLTLLGAAEIGANHNHLIETILALAIAGGCAAGWATRLILRQRLAGLALLALIAVQIGLAFQPQPWFVGELEVSNPPERYLSFMRNTPGEILADDIGLLLQAGKPIRYDDPSTMGPAAISGVWSEHGLIEDIEAQRFSAIMIPEDVVKEPIPYDGVGRWTEAVRTAIRERYELLYDDTVNTYVPKR
jgi:hypothetical protein